MNLPFKFDYYIEHGIVKKQSPNPSRAEFLIKEADKSFIGINNRVEKLGIDEFSANSLIKDIHDVIVQKIRAKMLLNGFNASGNFAHEAEVAYMKILNFSDYEASFVNELRKARNGITYYGRMFDNSYAEECYKFMMNINDKLMRLFLVVELIKNKSLKNVEKEFINNSRVADWGEENRKDFEKDFEPDTEWFFVKYNNKTLSFGCLRPITITYLGKKYEIMGICSILSLEKGKGYGRTLIEEMIKYLKKKGNTGLGFTVKTEFFKKAGLKAEKDFIQRFVYKNLKTGEEIIDNEGDGIYYNGKDNFIKKVLSNKSKVYIDIPHW